MEKLKPILEQKFWILSGLALIMPFIGWFIATKTYATGVEERETAIDGAFSSVKFSGDIPNQDWVDGAGVIVKAEQKRLDQAQLSLWESQKQSMKWPAGVHELMKDVEYEGEISSTARERYRLGYYRQLASMEKSIRAIDPLMGEGIVLLDRSVYTHIPDGTWASQPPISSEMWNAQIDFWLVQAVLESIESINRGAEKITEAPVRQVLELSLRGGQRGYSAGGGEGAQGGGYGGMGEGGGAYPGGGGGYGEYGGGAGGGGEFGGAGSNLKTNVKFDLSEELGPDSGGAGAGMSPGQMNAGSAPGGEYGGGEYGGGGESGSTGPDRYVDDDEGYPFRTRAFVLGVLMDHNELPKFMSELSRSDWPLQIIRVQMAAVNPDNLSDASRTATGGRPGVGPGMSPGAGGFGSPSPGGFGGGGAEGYSEGPSSGFSAGGGGLSGRPGTTRPGGNAGANAGLIQQAMTDPELAEVWIGGLITLFRPIEPVEDPNAVDQMDITSQPEDVETGENDTPVVDTEDADASEANGAEPTEDSSTVEDPESSEATPESSDANPAENEVENADDENPPVTESPPS